MSVPPTFTKEDMKLVLPSSREKRSHQIREPPTSMLLFPFINAFVSVVMLQTFLPILNGSGGRRGYMPFSGQSLGITDPSPKDLITPKLITLSP